MDNKSPENGPNQEYKVETRLSPEIVQGIYEETRIKNTDYDRPVFVKDSINQVAFNKNRLKGYRDIIEKLADQLQEDLYNKDTLGADIEYAYYKKGTLGVDIEHAYHNNIKLESAWTKDDIVRNQLLTLITAIGLGRVTSSSIVSKNSTPQNRKIRYLNDKETYAKKLKDEENV